MSYIEFLTSGDAPAASMDILRRRLDVARRLEDVPQEFVAPSGWLPFHLEDEPSRDDIREFCRPIIPDSCQWREVSVTNPVDGSIARFEATYVVLLDHVGQFDYEHPELYIFGKTPDGYPRAVGHLRSDTTLFMYYQETQGPLTAPIEVSKDSADARILLTLAEQLLPRV